MTKRNQIALIYILALISTILSIIYLKQRDNEIREFKLVEIKQRSGKLRYYKIKDGTMENIDKVTLEELSKKYDVVVEVKEWLVLNMMKEKEIIHFYL